MLKLLSVLKITTLFYHIVKNKTTKSMNILENPKFCFLLLLSFLIRKQSFIFFEQYGILSLSDWWYSYIKKELIFI